MRISELVSEQTIGTTGSTSGTPAQVNPISQTPGRTDAPGTDPTQNQKPDPNIQKLAATLKQNKVIDNEKEINDFLGAYQAQTTGKNLSDIQQATMAKLANALMKNRNLSTNLDLQIKASGAQKPGSPLPVQKAPGGI